MIINETKNKKFDKIISEVLSGREIHQKIIERFEKELELLPEGGLCQKKINGKFYLYHFIRPKDQMNTLIQKCLLKKDNKFASALKRRHFIDKSLPYLRSNLKAMDTFMQKYTPYDATDIESKLPKVYDNLPQICCQDIDEKVCVSNWLDENFKKNELYPERLIHGTLNGKKVRSKSEEIIAGLLEVYNVPYRYEAELRIGEHTYYPDFTVLKPRDGEIIYWEHFGMVNNLEYNKAMDQKLTTYRKHEIVPWEKLITTYDNKNGSIDAQVIQNIIKSFIL